MRVVVVGVGVVVVIGVVVDDDDESEEVADASVDWSRIGLSTTMCPARSAMNTGLVLGYSLEAMGRFWLIQASVLESTLGGTRSVAAAEWLAIETRRRCSLVLSLRLSSKSFLEEEVRVRLDDDAATFACLASAAAEEAGEEEEEEAVAA